MGLAKIKVMRTSSSAQKLTPETAQRLMEQEQAKNVQMAQSGIKAGLQIVSAFGGSGSGNTTDPASKATETAQPQAPAAGVSSAATATVEATKSTDQEVATQESQPSPGATGKDAVIDGKATGASPITTAAKTAKSETPATKETPKSKQATPAPNKPSGTSEGFGTAAKAIGSIAVVAAAINPIAGAVVGAVAGVCALVSSLTA